MVTESPETRPRAMARDRVTRDAPETYVIEKTTTCRSFIGRIARRIDDLG